MRNLLRLLLDAAPMLLGLIVGAVMLYTFIYRPQLDGLKLRVAILETQSNAQATVEVDRERFGAPTPIHPRVKPAPDNCCDEPVIGARSVQIPADSAKWHSILFLAPDYETRPDQVAAKRMCDTDPWFISLRSQTNWHVIRTSSAEFKVNWQPSKLISMTPCLLIERANGEVIYRESGPQLGTRPRALERQIKAASRRHCPDGRCLPLHPTPDDKNQKEEEIPAVLKMDEAPPKAEKKKGSPFGALLLAGIFGVVAYQVQRGAGFIRQVRTAH